MIHYNKYFFWMITMFERTAFIWNNNFYIYNISAFAE